MPANFIATPENALLHNLAVAATGCLLATAVWLLAAGPVAASEVDAWGPQGEAHLETFPDLEANIIPPPPAPVSPSSSHPWWAAGLTLAAPGLMATPAMWGVWLPALAAPAALGVGHLYAGEPARASMVCAGGFGASVLGALGGAGLAQGMGLPTTASALVGSGIGFAGFASWAAFDAYQLVAARTQSTQRIASKNTAIGLNVEED